MGGMVFSYEGESLDAIYEDLSLEYPEFFDYETESDPKLQLERISEVLSSLKPTYENPYSSGMAVWKSLPFAYFGQTLNII